MLPTLIPASPRAHRNAQRLQRRELLKRVASGESRQDIAVELGLSLRSVQRALKRAAKEQPKEARDIHAALQIERIRRALQLTDARIAAGDLNAVFAMTRLLPLLNQYEEFEQERDLHDILWSAM